MMAKPYALVAGRPSPIVYREFNGVRVNFLATRDMSLPGEVGCQIDLALHTHCAVCEQPLRYGEPTRWIALTDARNGDLMCATRTHDNGRCDAVALYLTMSAVVTNYPIS